MIPIESVADSHRYENLIRIDKKYCFTLDFSYFVFKSD